MTDTSTNESFLWQNYLELREHATRDKLLNIYMPLVFKTVARLAQKLPSGLDKDDMLSIGAVGLIDAIEKWPLRSGKWYCENFRPFALARIKCAILDQIHSMNWKLRLDAAHYHNYLAAKKNLMNSLGHEPTDCEIADILGISETKVIEMKQMHLRFSLECLLEQNGSEEENLDLLVIPEEEQPETITESLENLKILVNELSIPEKAIIAMYYYDNFSIPEIAASLGYSITKVSQLHLKALDTLKSKMNLSKKVH